MKIKLTAIRRDLVRYLIEPLFLQTSSDFQSQFLATATEISNYQYNLPKCINTSFLQSCLCKLKLPQNMPW